MKFLVPNYSCLQNHWLRGYRPRIPVLSVLCPQLNLLNPPRKKFLGTPLCHNACITWLSESTNSERGKSHGKKYICPLFFKSAFVRFSSKVHSSAFLQKCTRPLFFKSAFVRFSSKVHSSAFLQKCIRPLFFKSTFARVYSTYICPCSAERTFCPRMIDRTFVRMAPYICPSLIKHTSVRILSNEVRFTKQVCPESLVTSDFGQNTPEFGPQRPLFGPTRCQVKDAVCNHQLTQPSYSTRHVSRTE